MARRSAWGLLSRMANKQARWVMRRAASAGQGVLRLASRSSVAPRKPRVAAPVQGWSEGMSLSPSGLRRYGFYKPPNLSSSKPSPLLVMLHGCGQDALEFSASTQMNQLAKHFGFMVLYPRQDRQANPMGCWNWFQKRSGRAKLEAASIVTALDHVSSLHAIDRARVAIAGLSAGASMAALTALHFPRRFAAVVMHSGVEPTSANSSATAVAAMHGRFRVPLHQADKDAAVLPALLVIQGNADPVVTSANGLRAALRWAAHCHAQPEAARAVRHGKRYAFSTMDWFVGERLQVTYKEISGLGHAWSGGAASQAYSDPKGPDASRMVWAFAKQQFEQIATENESSQSH